MYLLTELKVNTFARMYSESNSMFPTLQAGFENGISVKTQAIITGPWAFHRAISRETCTEQAFYSRNWLLWQ